MKLFYYPVPDGNFGDYLNEWLWDNLLPDFFDDKDDEIFVGIGTLLNDKVPPAKRTLVFGSGVGYGSGLPTLDASWTIYCVRGPLSAKALGLEENLAITDAALLLRQIYTPPETTKPYAYAYMPHVHCMRIGGESLQRVCEDIGIHFIDPRWSVEKVLSSLSQTQVLLAEAMHGIIVADAMRIPWIPIVTNRTILPFKWEDWAQSMKLRYKPQHTIGLWDPPATFSMRYLKNPYIPLNGIRKKMMAQQFKNIIRTQQPTLSDESWMNQQTERLAEKIDVVRQQWANQPC